MKESDISFNQSGISLNWEIKLISFLFIFCCFQPYIGLSFLPSDTQPFATLFGIFLIFLLRSKYDLLPGPAIFLLVILGFALVSILFSFFGLYEDKDLILMIRSFWGYLTAPVIFIAFYRMLKVIDHKMITSILKLILLILFLGYILNIFYLSEIIQFFVNRAIYEDASGVADVARGLTSFYPEQSRISEQLGIMFFALFLLDKLNLRIILILLFGAFLSFAGQFYVVLIEILIAYLISRFLISVSRSSLSELLRMFSFLFFGFIIFLYIFLNPFVVSSITDFLIDLGLPSRGLEAVSTVLVYGTSGFSSDEGLIVKLSGPIASLATLIENPLNFEMGTVFDNDQLRISISETHFLIERFIFGNDKLVFFDFVYSSLGTVIIDFGIYGLILSSFFLLFLSKNSLKASLESNEIKYLVCFFFLLFCFFIKIPLANPSLWALSALLYYYCLNMRSKSVKDD